MGGLDRGTLLALGAMAMSVFVIANDVTALSVALPDIEADFDSDVTTVQWVINAYALVFGVLIVTGGRLADMFGRRRLFFVGSAVFASGMQWSFRLVAALALVGFLVSVLFVGVADRSPGNTER
jgi:MFS family permease